MFEAIGHPILILSPERKILTANRAALKHLGCTEQELYGCICYQVVHAEGLVPDACPLNRALESGRFEAAEIHVDSVCQDYVVTVFPIHDASGHVTCIMHVMADLTETRRVRRLQQRVLSLTQEIVAIADESFLVTYVNKAWIDLFGQSAEGARASFLDVVHPDDRAYVRRLLQGALTEECETLPTFESCVTTPAGEKRTVSWRASVSPKDRLITLLGRDTTEQTSAQQRLDTSESEHRAALDSLLDAVHVVDRRLRVLQMNRTARACSDCLGADTEPAGESLFELFPFLTYRIREEYEHVFRTGTPLVTHETTPFHGSEVHTETHKIPICCENDVQRVLTVVRDLTEVTRAEASLRKSERLYRTLVQTLPDAVLTFDLKGRITYASPQAAALLHVDDPSELVGDSALAWMAPEDHKPVLRELRELLDRESPREVAFTALRKDGTSFPMDARGGLLRDSEGRPTGLVVTSRDATERKCAEEARMNLEAQLIQSQKMESIGTLASGVAHEINNPLTGVINYAQLIHERIEDPTLRNYAERIMAEGDRVATIVRNLLSFSRQDTSTIELVSVRDLVDATLSLIGAELRRHRIELSTTVQPGLPYIHGQKQRLEQVLLNLLANARDALNAKYPNRDPEKRVELSAGMIEQEARAFVEITVTDHGPGIPVELQERVFDPFFTTKGRNKGTGLGLSISYGIIREHGGSLTVESEPGESARFRILLPVKAAPPD